MPLATGSGDEIVLITDRPIPRGTLPLDVNAREIVAPSRSSRLWSLFTFPKVCAREKVDVAHVQYTISPLMKTPTVTTIHDVSYFIEPQWFGWKDRTLLRMSVPASARRAARVIAVSETSRQEIIQHLGMEPEKVVATLLGVPTICRFVPRQEGISYAASKLGIHNPYLLFVGGLNPRKNWLGALEATALARQSWKDLELVITGPKRIDPAALDAAVNRLGAGKWLHLPGGIPEADLPLAYGGAVAVIHPSLHEGFGLTPLEAFACGTPVIASNRGAIPEVAGDAAILLDPLNTEEWAQAILSLQYDATRRIWIEKGLFRSKQFSWKRTAEQTLDVYRAASFLA